MDRRLFLKRSATSLAAVAALTIVPMSLTGCDDSWIQVAINDMPTIGEILESVTAIALEATGNGLLTPVAEAVITGAIGTATVALTAAQTAIAAYKANPTAGALADVEAAMIALQPKLADILSAVHVKDSALIATISGAVNLAISVVGAIQLLINNTTNGGGGMQASRSVTLLTPSQIADQYNTLVTAGGYGRHKIHRHTL